MLDYIIWAYYNPKQTRRFANAYLPSTMASKHRQGQEWCDVDGGNSPPVSRHHLHRGANRVVWNSTSISNRWLHCSHACSPYHPRKPLLPTSTCQVLTQSILTPYIYTPNSPTQISIPLPSSQYGSMKHSPSYKWDQVHTFDNSLRYGCASSLEQSS